MQTASLSDFQYIKSAKKLLGYSDLFAGEFPKEFKLISHHTGAEIVFRPITPDHPLYDEDGYDGEQALFSPAFPIATVSILILGHRC